jgi:hypothetical protein
MHCAYCSEKIIGKPICEGAECYCSLECAYLASGIDPDETGEYYEEDLLEEFLQGDE